MERDSITYGLKIFQGKSIIIIYIKNDTKLFYFLFDYRLIKSQLTNHRQSIYICNTCLIHFHSETALNKH